MTATAYETTFQSYETDRERLTRWVRKNYLEEFKINAPRTVLDVACGNGFWGSILAEHGLEVSGFDLNESYIADGQSKWPELDLVTGDVEGPFPHSQRFRLVFVRTLPQFYAQDLQASLPIMRRILDATATNGAALLTFYTDESAEPTDRGWWLWRESDFRRLIEDAGGKLAKIHRIGNYLIVAAHPGPRPGVTFPKKGTESTYPQSFSRNGLAQLEDFLNEASAVVPMREAPHARDVVAMRHDVDHSLEHALTFARWEEERGYRSTYFLLHTAPYWQRKDRLYEAMREMVDMGHEVGLHVNAVIQAKAEGRLNGQDGGANPAGNCHRAAEILHSELSTLRAEGFDVVGTAAHGDARCTEWNLSNLDIWAAGYQPKDFGLQYEAYHRHVSASYLSDNGGRWVGADCEPLTRPHFHKSLATHLLVHPIHWPVNE